MSEYSATPIADQKLLRLNQWQTVFVVLGVVFSIAATCGAYWILPYRMSTMEAHQLEVEARYEKIFAAQEARIKSLEDGWGRARELMIRIDERTKSIQDKLKIPHEDSHE
jgi:hypothetical protein